MSNLKPCPFCGSDNVSIKTEHDPDGFGVFLSVQCGKCRARSGDKFASETCPQTYAEVRHEWNQREESKEVKRKVVYDAFMWTASELSKPEQDLLSAMAVTYINDKWPLDYSGKDGQ